MKDDRVKTKSSVPQRRWNYRGECEIRKSQQKIGESGARKSIWQEKSEHFVLRKREKLNKRTKETAKKEGKPPENREKTLSENLEVNRKKGREEKVRLNQSEEHTA